MRKVLLNVSYCAQHFKGGDGINQMDAGQHAEWLEQAVCFYQSQVDWPIVVAVTGFRGMLYAEAGRERDAYWRIFDKAMIIGHAENPSHQTGAAVCIRIGLEAAGKLGFDYMVHCAEDTVPQKGVLNKFLEELEKGADYTGEKWGIDRTELNSQFFGCRVQALCPIWDACRVPEHGWIERYMEYHLRGKPKWLAETCLYKTCHDFNQWREWVKEVQA